MLTGIPEILIKILKDVPASAAIINQRGAVLCANPFFERSFPSWGRSCKAPFPLQHLNLKIEPDGGTQSPQEVILPEGTVGSLLVYFINKSKKGENRFLILVKPDQGDTEATSDLNGFLRNKGVCREEPSEPLAPEFRELIGEDPRFRNALLIAQRAAKSDLPVLILGESGTGKEILARAIHRTSRRSRKPLVDVNCAAIPDTLIESELFGYERGAFTGARTEGRSGYFDVAHEGTILLDEIGDASLQSQSKLLRVLEDGCFKRVGGNRNVTVDVRIISATNKNLKNLIAEKAFREDLFYRLNTFTLQLPPLRDRVRDIPLLVEHFISSSANEEHRTMKFLPQAMEILQSYHWPGNVRELKGVVNYAVNMSTSPLVAPAALPSFLFPSGGPAYEVEIPRYEPKTSTTGGPLSDVLQTVERDLIREAIEASSNKSEAIKKLGISRRTFYLKIKQYGLG